MLLAYPADLYMPKDPVTLPELANVLGKVGRYASLVSLQTCTPVIRPVSLCVGKPSTKEAYHLFKRDFPQSQFTSLTHVV